MSATNFARQAYGQPLPTWGIPVGGEDNNGNFIPFLFDATGKLIVAVTGAGSGGTSSVDKDAFTVGASAGTPVMGVINPSDTPSNGLLAIAALDSSRRLKVAGSFSSTPVSSSTVSSAGPTTVGTSPVTLLAANSSRLRFSLQNVGTTKLWILFGAGTPSSALYHIALPLGGTANDGSSPIYIDTMWLGLVQAISSGAGGSIAVGEFTA